MNGLHWWAEEILRQRLSRAMLQNDKVVYRTLHFPVQKGQCVLRAKTTVYREALQSTPGISTLASLSRPDITLDFVFLPEDRRVDNTPPIRTRHTTTVETFMATSSDLVKLLRLRFASVMTILSLPVCTTILRGDGSSNTSLDRLTRRDQRTVARVELPQIQQGRRTDSQQALPE